MNFTQLESRLGLLERRVASIESRLAIEPPSTAQVTLDSPEMRTADAGSERGIPPYSVGNARGGSFAPVEQEPVKVIPPPIPRPALEPPAAAPVMAYQPAARPKPAPRGPLEQTIGLKWAGWIGAIVLVIGAGLGIKFAVDNGWLGALPASVRLGLMYLGGFALIGAGEAVYRRVNDIASAGVFAAGVASLFLVSYAGHAYYGLYARDTAFILMAIATLVGAGVAIRGRLVSVAALSIIGANLAPVVLKGDMAHVAPFLSYLLMLELVALVLAWWGASPKWWMLRALSLATTALWMTTVILQVGHQIPNATTPFVFLLLFALLYQLELILSTMRVSVTPDTKSDPAAQPGVIFSLLVTGALTGGMLLLFRANSEHARGAWTLAFAAIAALTGFLLPHRKFPSLLPLSIGYRVQAAALVVLAVPVLLHGHAIVIGWSILAVAFAVMGATLRLDVSRRAGACTWFLAAIYTLNWAWLNPHAREVWATIFNTPIPAYFFIVAILTVAGHIVALLMQGSSDALKKMALFTSACAGVAFIAASIASLPTIGATTAIVLYAWLLFFADLVLPRRGLVYLALGVLLLATIKWVVLDNLADRIAPGWSATRYTPVLNPIMGLGMLIAISLAGIAWIRREALLPFARGARDDSRASESHFTLALASFVLVMLTIGLSFEIDRVVEQVRATSTMSWAPFQAKNLAWTMLWTATSCAILALTRLLEPSGIARAKSLARLAILPILFAIKFIVIDTFFPRANADPAHVVVVANLQMLTALFVLAGLALAWFLTASPEPKTITTQQKWIGFIALIVLLWTGTLEIDRWATYQLFGQPWFVRQLGLSIFWSLFAIACVALGFRARAAALRYFGLALFAVTLAKVVLVDLGQISTGYRVLSFMGVGLLLLGTSVLYGKLSPRLLSLGTEQDGQ